MNSTVISLLAMLPDRPRWVEARSMLLSGRGEFIPGGDPPRRGMLFQRDTCLAVIVGRPDATLIREVAAGAHEVLAVPEDVDWAAAALPEWVAEVATLHVLPDQTHLPLVSPGSVRLLGEGEAASLSDLPLTLREELAVAQRAGTAIAAALHEGRPVAFCYAGAVTETWWDISIDTVAPYRRRGYAGRCVAHQVHHYTAAGKAPVWGAVASNEASVRLAARLGFVPSDRLVVFGRGPLATGMERR